MHYKIYFGVALFFFVLSCFAGRKQFREVFESPFPGAFIALVMGLLWPVVLFLCLGAVIIDRKARIL